MNKIVLTLIYLSLFIDSINGFFIIKYGLSLGAHYKFFILCLIIFILLFQYRKMYFYLFLTIFCSAFSLIELFHIYAGYSNNLNDVIINFNWSLKYLLFITSLIFFYNSLKRNDFKINTIWYLFAFIYSIIAIHVIAGTVLGIGFQQYEDTYGFKGFYYAGNEVAIILLISFSLILSLLLIKSLYFYSFLFFLLSVIISAFFSMKSTILGVFMIYLLYLITIFMYKSRFRHLRIPKSFTLKYIFILILSLVVFGIGIYIWWFYVGMSSRILYFLLVHDSIITLALSARNLFAQDLLDFISNNFKFNEFLFGIGLSRAKQLELKFSEIDILDLFIVYGLIGTFLIFSTYILLIFLLKHKSKNLFGKFITNSFVLIFFLSFLAGHTVNSGVIAIPLGAFVASGLRYGRSKT